MPAVSVIIPTHRPRCLERTLDALARQSLLDFEVIIVENGEQTDGVRDIPHRYRGWFPGRYYFVARNGLNRARNHGIKHCRSQIITLLDDDCIPEENWISAICSAHTQFPMAGVIGGRVLLAFDHPQPDWVVDHFRRQLSELDLGTEEQVLKNEYLVGANLSFRRRVYDKVGGFNENIGMVGRDGPQLCNDELDFVQRTRNSGTPGAVYDGRICVHHLITKQRTNINYFEKRAYGQGISDVVIYEQASPQYIQLQQLLMEKLYLHTGHWRRLNQVLAGLSSQTRETYQQHYARCRLRYLEGMVHRIDGQGGLMETNYPVQKQRTKGFQAVMRLHQRAGIRRRSGLIARRLQRLSLGRAVSAASLGGYETARERVSYLAGMQSALDEVDVLEDRYDKPGIQNGYEKQVQQLADQAAKGEDKRQRPPVVTS